MVGAEPADEFLVGGGGVGDDAEAVGLGQLDEVAAHRAGGAGDGEESAGGEVTVGAAGGAGRHDHRHDTVARGQ
ncbi:hypothetical protein ACIHAR_07355 [Streptomyces sp. NPDC052016]|uniref:hypothetical protein n=1 Tax=Streptomyces sp. NPDC052016 TaxID=3365680 RepID=UPI0037D43883